MERVPDTLVSRAEALRFGTVLAASGPVVLRAFALGPADMDGTICWRLPATVPLYLSRTTTWGLLSLAELLLPAILAGLLLLSSRWTVPLGAVAVLAVLAFRLLVTLRVVFAGRLLEQSPWPSIVCYGAAFLMLLAVTPSPRPRAGKEVVFWTATAGAAAWMAARLPVLLRGEANGLFGWVAYGEPRSLWNFPVLWSCKADVDGLLVVLVALVATASSVLADRARHRLLLATATLLVIAALEGYVPAVILMDTEKLRQEFQFETTMLIRWHLLIAAALVVAAAFAVRPVRPDAVPS
ncbi:hypothetical protein IL992_41840 [Microbispora sp. NEAU-D428]|uniref:hypothetical protein n=1 Tax=Microbispora sitophila TaxID=2771537 RepID=UPI001867D645|nr:hypothetical protein [Microbispora sitophila]MBE3015661.1 hypothetical protein [Microbispora sitophila]